MKKYLCFLSSKDILEVIMAADIFLLLGLKGELENKVIRDFIDEESCLDLLVFAGILLLPF